MSNSISRHITLVLRISQLLVYDYLSARMYLTGLQALVPCVIKFCVTGASTISKPGTAPTTATAHAGFLRDAAYGACRTRERLDCCVRVTLVGDAKGTLAVTGTKALPKVSTCKLPRAYVCMPLSPRATCNERYCRQHLRTSRAKHLQERNNLFCQTL